MKIALDFDNTFTKEPQLWLNFIHSARMLGNEVKIVTSRHPGCPVHFNFAQFGIDVIYCSATAKRKHYDADVWIDDDPKHIDLDHDMSLIYPTWKSGPAEPVDHHPV